MERAQLKVFGGREANDFFLGRKGAHEETLHAAEILLDNGIVPRLQIYLNRRGVGSIDEFLRDYEATDSKIRRRNIDSGNHCMTFGSDGYGLMHHRYRIEPEDLDAIPRELIQSTESYNGKAFELKTEKELGDEILGAEDQPAYPENHWLWFFVDQKMDVYPNLMGFSDAWRLGNVNTDTWEQILTCYVNDGTPGLNKYFSISKHELVHRHLSAESRKLFSGADDLLEYYAALELRG